MAQKNRKKRSADRSKKVLPPPSSSLFDKMKSKWSNSKYTTVLCCFKLRKQTNISVLEFKMLKLKENFGVEYISLVGDNASVKDLERCLTKGLEEFYVLQGEIDDNLAQIDEKVQRINKKMETSLTDKQAPIFHPKKSTKVNHKKTQKGRDTMSCASFNGNDSYYTVPLTPVKEKDEDEGSHQN